MAGLEGYGYSFIDITKKTDKVNRIMLKPEECDKIISQAKKGGMKTLSVNKGEKKSTNPNIRSATGTALEWDDETDWIYQKIQTAIGEALTHIWPFEVSGMQPLQVMKYNIGDKYEAHIDLGPGEDAAFRKIGFTLQLTPEEDYTGGELAMMSGGEWHTASKDQGSFTIFPSYILHEVRPVETGERWALVGWFTGDRPFS
jgi:PKHD-type hydroxylase